MGSLKAFRTRAMPSTISRRDLIASNSWRDPNMSFQRQASTAYDLLRSSDDPRASAILHGRRRPALQPPHPSNHDRSAKESPSLHQNTSKPQQPQRIKAHPGSADTHPRNGNRNSISRGGKRQREAEMLGDSRPARRRRTEPTSAAPLKDAEYIRRTMRVPTIHDYSMLKQTFFANPKEQLHNALQGSGKIRTNFTGIGQDLFRCTVSCTLSSSEPAEVVAGEGRSKVFIFGVTRRAATKRL
jgi:hypothetical protein